MGKTVFSDGMKTLGQKGTRVTAAHLNGFQNHRHDGADQDGSAPIDYVAATGTANAIAVSFIPAIAAHVTGLPLFFKALAVNTGAVTVAINGLAAKNLLRPDGAALTAGDIAANALVMMAYDGTDYRVMSSSGFTIKGDFVASIGTNGYQKLPTGLILQWGYSQNGTVTFPLAFPNACCSVVGTANLANSVDTDAVDIGTVSKTSFSLGVTKYPNTASPSGYAWWIAIGY